MSEIMKTELAERIEQLIAEAKKRTISAVNTAMVYTYYEIGRIIVDDEQQGEERAQYGKAVLKELSIRLTNKFGKGFSVENLDRMRYFYKTYSKTNSSTLLTNSYFTLSWSHYLKLMRIDNPEEYQTGSYHLQAIDRDKKALKNLKYYIDKRCVIER